MLCWPCCHYSRKQDNKRWSLLELFFYVSWGPKMLWLNFFIFLHVNKTAEKLHVAVLLILFRYTRTPTALVIRILLVINVRVPLGGGSGQPFYMTFFIFFTYWRDGDGRRWFNLLLFWSLWEGENHYWGVFPFIHVSHERDLHRYHFLFYLISYKRSTAHNSVKRKFRIFILLYWKHKHKCADETTKWSVVFLLFFIAKSKPYSFFLMFTPLFLYWYEEKRGPGSRNAWISFLLLFNAVKQPRYTFVALLPLIVFYTKRNRDLEVVEHFSWVLPIYYYCSTTASTRFYSLLFCRRRAHLEGASNLTAIFPIMYHKYADGEFDFLLSLLWYKNIDYIGKRASYNTLPLPLYRKVVTCSSSLEEFDKDDFTHRFEMFFPFYFRRTHRTKGIDDLVVFPLFWKRETFEGRVRRKMLLFNLYGTIHSVENPDKPGECTTGFDILWPLIHYEKNAAGTFSYIRVLPFFYSKYQEGHHKLTVVFPFYLRVLFDPLREDDTCTFRQTVTVVLPFGFRETNTQQQETKTKAGLLYILPPYYRDHSFVKAKTKRSRSFWPFFGKKHTTSVYRDKNSLSIGWPLFQSRTRLEHYSAEKVHSTYIYRRFLTFTWSASFSFDNPSPGARSRSDSSITHPSTNSAGEFEELPLHLQMERLDRDAGSLASEEQLSSRRQRRGCSSGSEDVHSVAERLDGHSGEERESSGPSVHACEEDQASDVGSGQAGLPDSAETSAMEETESSDTESTEESESDDYDISLSSESSGGGYGGGLLGGADSQAVTSIDTALEFHDGPEPDQDRDMVDTGVVEAESTTETPARVAERKRLQAFPFFLWERNWGRSGSKFHWRIPGICCFTKSDYGPPAIGHRDQSHSRRVVWDLALLYFLSVKLALCRFCTSKGNDHSVILRYVMPIFYYREASAREQMALFWLFHPVLSLLCKSRVVGTRDATYRFGPFLVAKTDSEGHLKTIRCLTLCGFALIRYHRGKHFHVFPLFYSHCSGNGAESAWHWALLGYSRAALFFRSHHRTYLLFIFYSERHVRAGQEDSTRYSFLWLFHYRAALFHYDSDWRWFILFVVYKDLPKAGKRSAYLWLFHPVVSVVYHEPERRTSVFPIFWRSFYKKGGNDESQEEKWALLWLFHPFVSLVFYDTARVFRVFLLCWISNDEAAPDQLALGWILHPRYSVARYQPEGTSHILLLGWKRAQTQEWGLVWLFHYSIAASAKRNLEPDRKRDNPSFIVYFLIFLVFLQMHGVTHWLVCLLFYKRTDPEEDVSVFRFLYRLILYKSRNGTVTHLELNPLVFYRNTATRQLTLLLSGLVGSRKKNITLLWCIKIAK